MGATGLALGVPFGPALWPTASPPELGHKHTTPGGTTHLKDELWRRGRLHVLDQRVRLPDLVVAQVVDHQVEPRLGGDVAQRGKHLGAGVEEGGGVGLSGGVGAGARDTRGKRGWGLGVGVAVAVAVAALGGCGQGWGWGWRWGRPRVSACSVVS